MVVAGAMPAAAAASGTGSDAKLAMVWISACLECGDSSPLSFVATRPNFCHSSKREMNGIASSSRRQSRRLPSQRLTEEKCFVKSNIEGECLQRVKWADAQRPLAIYQGDEPP
jgi:hypothetical protein